MDEAKRLELEQLVEKLKNIRGKHTELITVLVPAGFNLITVQKQLEAEQSTASNIKSRTTRNNVLEALEKVVRFLKGLKEQQKNGLAIFCGNISEKEGQTDIELFSIEPPQLLKTRLYRCDQTFVLEPLTEMLEAKEIYGLVVLDRKEATFGLLEGKQIKVLRHITSGIQGKFAAGGQSAARLHRVIEGQVKEFYRRISDHMKEIFFNMPKLKGILIGGPIPTKEEFMKEGQLITALKDKVIALKDMGYADEHGLELLVEASNEDLKEQEMIKEKKILEKFFETLGRNHEKAAYGEKEVRKALQMGAVDVLLISKKVEKEKISEFSEMAKNTGASIELISTENVDGEQFFNLTKGVGALLRFAIE